MMAVKSYLGAPHTAQLCLPGSAGLNFADMYLGVQAPSISSVAPSHSTSTSLLPALVSSQSSS